MALGAIHSPKPKSKTTLDLAGVQLQTRRANASAAAVKAADTMPGPPGHCLWQNNAFFWRRRFEALPSSISADFSASREHLGARGMNAFPRNRSPLQGCYGLTPLTGSTPHLSILHRTSCRRGGKDKLGRGWAEDPRACGCHLPVPGRPLLKWAAITVTGKPGSLGVFLTGQSMNRIFQSL